MIAASTGVTDKTVVKPIRWFEIAPDVLDMWARGDTVATIVGHFPLDPRTVKKAIRWFPQRSV